MLSSEGLCRSTLYWKKGCPRYSMSSSLDSWWHGAADHCTASPGPWVLVQAPLALLSGPRQGCLSFGRVIREGVQMGHLDSSCPPFWNYA